MSPALSIVIPTYNRADVLRQTLDALEAAVQEGPTFELIVIDDGSTDETPKLLEEAKGRFGGSLLVLRQKNRGPAAARNAGTRSARAPVVLYLGDDTIPEPQLPSAHLRHHTGGTPTAVIGYTPYHADSGDPKLLFFLQEMGHQFGYGLIRDPDDLAFNFVYSSNLSVPRALLGKAPFGEEIRSAAWEDVELGYRLKRQGVRVVFEPAAVAHHLHPTTLLSFCRRQEMVGATSLDALSRCPELLEFFGGGKPSRKILRAEWPLRLAARGLQWLMQRRISVYSPRLFRAILDLHYHRGLRRAQVTGRLASGS